jgi:hypothetical protein
MTMSVKDLLVSIIELVSREGDGKMSMALTIADEDGIASTVKVSKSLEQAQPGHMDRQIIILNAMYYKRYCEEAMEPTTFMVDTSKSGDGTVQ